MKKQCLKRILSMVLSLMLIVGVSPITALAEADFGGEANADWKNFDEFSSEVSKLLSETMEDNYISAISLEVGSGEMVVDGEEQPLVESRDVTPVTKDDVVMLPVRALAELEKAAVSYDAEQRAATVQSEDGEIVFTKGDITVAVSDGETEYKTLAPLTTEPELINDTMYVPLNTMADFFGYDTETIDSNKVLLTKPYQTKRLIVKSEEKKIETYGAKQEISGFNDLHILQYETEEDARKAREKLVIDGSVDYAEPDLVMTTAEVHKSWGADYIGADTYNQYLQENTYLDDVVVAVADTGVDSEHEFLQDRIIPVNKNFVNSDTNSNDIHSHGTHVSGIVVDATLPNVKILPVKVMGDDGKGTTLSIYNGVMFAIEQDCDVINMSLGGFGKSELQEEAILAAVSKNISVIAAAGNDSVDAAMCSPANIEEAITVGAITKSGSYAYYSNYGAVVDIWAPGSNINSSIPENKFEQKNGTSMAAPHVAAAAAMLKTYDRTLSPRQIEGALQEYAKKKKINEPKNTGTSKVMNVEMLENFRKSDVPTVEKPLADKEAGEYYQDELVLSLSCATEGATIRYTTDGTIPTADSGEVYTGPLTLQTSTRLIAKAFKEGAMESYALDNLYCVSEYPESLHYQQYSYYDIWQYTYPDNNAKYLKITFDEDSYIPFPGPSTADYSTARLNKYGLHIYDAKMNTVNNEFADIERDYFVFDELQGKSVIVPGNSFTIFLNGPYGSDDYGFKVKSVEPRYETRLSAPKFVTPCGNDYYPRQEFSKFMLIGASIIDYAENKTVVLKSQEGGDIYYTLDGSTPTKSSLKYTEPILLDEPKKIRARVYKDGYIESEAVSEDYYSSKYPETIHYQKRDYYFQNAWEWKAPSDVKYIAVTFDEKTDLNSRENINNLWLDIYKDIYDIGRQRATRFYENELAGRTIYIKGNYFRMFCGGDLPERTDAPYGFKITNIRYYYNEDDVIPIESIEISGPGTIKEGQSAQMTAKVTPENANVGFFWRMAWDKICADVDDNGVVIGKEIGTARLVATSNFINSINNSNMSSNPNFPNYSYNGAYKEITVTSPGPPTGTVSYSTTSLTNQDVVATITTNSSAQVTNNGGSKTYTFTENGEFTFELANSSGKTASVTAKVDWIDKESPTATLTYSPQTATNGEVLVTVTPSEEVTVTNTENNRRSILITGNGPVRFEFMDLAGNTGFVEEEVTWIDKSDIAAEFVYEDLSDDRVKATLQTSKPVTITNNSGSAEYIFSENSAFTFKYQYDGGKTGSATANVCWLYKPAITYDITTLTSKPVTAVIELPPGVIITNNDGSNSYTFNQNGTFTFEFVDFDGHKGSATAKVTWIITDGEVEIYSAEDLVSFAEIINNGNSIKLVKACLMQDIDMSGTDWTPIGTSSNAKKFNITFDGQGFTIYNLIMNVTKSCSGLFGWTGKDAVIRNVHLDNCMLSGSNILGSIAGYNEGIIENCSVSGEINGSSNVGGVVGFNKGAVRNCYMNGTVTCMGTYSGGIVGSSSTESVIENCCSAGKVQDAASKNYMAGIVGSMLGTVKNSYSICIIESTANSGASGGIAGRLTGSIESCIALNPYITDLIGCCNRIFGAYGGSPILSDNYAWSGMQLGTEQDKAAVLDDEISPLSHSNGKGVSNAEVHTKAFWETAGFTFGDDAWTWNEDKMPSLAVGEPFDWPEWLSVDEELTPSPTPTPEHIHSLVKTEAKEASCTTDGNSEYWKCEGKDACNKIYSDAECTTEILEIPIIYATGHSEVTDAQVEPTCETDGKTSGTHCSVCQIIITTQTTIPKLNHNWSAWNITTEPTLTTPGIAERICANDSKHKDKITVPVLTDETVWTTGTRIEPTETADGLQTYISIYGVVVVILPAKVSEYDYSIKYENGKAVVTVSQDGAYTLIFAAYDTDNRLLSVNAQDVHLVKGENPPISPQNFNADSKIKILLWDSLTGMRPLAKTESNRGTIN